MKYKCTIFETDGNPKSKLAWSPFKDNSFIFKTHEIKDLRALYDVYVSNWTLNVSADLLTEALRTYRRRDYIGKYTKNINYCVLNLDNIKSSENRDKVLEFFKDYRCVIGKSRSYNEKQGIFNLKGVLGITVQDIKELEHVLQEIKIELNEYCDVDVNTSKPGSFNAPIGKKKILLSNYDTDKLYTYSDKKLPMKELESLLDIPNIQDKQQEVKRLRESKTISEMCVKVFSIMGFKTIIPKPQTDYAKRYPEYQKFEKDSKSYYWISATPYIMRHNLLVESINIYKAVSFLDIGKKLQNEQDYKDGKMKFETDKMTFKYVNISGKGDTKFGKDENSNNKLDFKYQVTVVYPDIESSRKDRKLFYDFWNENYPGQDMTYSPFTDEMRYVHDENGNKIKEKTGRVLLKAVTNTIWNDGTTKDIKIYRPDNTELTEIDGNTIGYGSTGKVFGNIVLNNTKDYKGLTFLLSSIQLFSYKEKGEQDISAVDNDRVSTETLETFLGNSSIAPLIDTYK